MGTVLSLSLSLLCVCGVYVRVAVTVPLFVKTLFTRTIHFAHACIHSLTHAQVNSKVLVAIRIIQIFIINDCIATVVLKNSNRQAVAISFNSSKCPNSIAIQPDLHHRHPNSHRKWLPHGAHRNYLPNDVVVDVNLFPNHKWQCPISAVVVVE